MIITYTRYVRSDITQFKFYQRPNGKEEAKQYLQSLPKKVNRKMTLRINVIQSLGYLIASGANYSKHIRPYKNLFEIRMRFSNRQERIIYFCLFKDIDLMLNGFTKTSPQKQRRAIRHALYLKREAERRYKNGKIKIS